MIMQLLMIASAGVVVNASTTDEDLAQLLADLEGNDTTVQPQAAADTTAQTDTGTTTETDTGTVTDTGVVAETDTGATEEHQAAEDILGSMDSDKWAYA